MITVDVRDPQTGRIEAVTVPVRTPEEAFRYLYAVGGGLAGEGSRDLYLRTVLEPIRARYKAQLQQIETEIIRRQAAIGANATEGKVWALAVWAARQRANTARIWRIPQRPAQILSWEARDLVQYGPGGRTFANLLKRQELKRGPTGRPAYEYIIGSAVVDNAKATAQVARSARFLRRGGAALG